MCKLQKALYCLKHPPQTWFEKLKLILLNSIEFKGFVVDSYLFIKYDNEFFVLLFTLVDDIAIKGTSTSLVESVITSINAQFTLKDRGNLNYFLGIEVTSCDYYLLLNQKKYVQDLNMKVGITDLSSFPTPMTS